MKRFFLTALVGGILASCGTQKNTQVGEGNTPVTASVSKLKGDWKITEVTYDKGFNIKPFNQGADAQCFVGSTWRLIPNNYSGAYNLNGGGKCPTITQPIKFEVTKDNEFRFKHLQADVKAKNVIEGYVLQLQNHTQNTFTLVQDVPFEGRIIKVYYQFERLINAH